MRLRIKLLIPPLPDVIATAKAVTDAEEDMFAAEPEELRTGYVFLEGDARSSMCQKITDVFP